MEIYNFNINNNPYEVKVVSIKGTMAVVDVNGIKYNVDISDIGDLDIAQSAAAVAQKPAAVASAPAQTAAPTQTTAKPAAKPAVSSANVIASPMPGQVFKILVKKGDAIKVGDIVITIEAMKMENQIRATKEGTVSEIHVNEGDVVAEGAPLVSLGG